MPVVSDVLELWRADEPRYQEFSEPAKLAVRSVLRDAHIVPERISVRVKDSASLAKKVLRNEYSSYEEVTDKLGVRVVTRISSDVDRAVEALRATLGGVIEDKREQENPQSFDYRSVHLQIQGLPLDTRFSDLECEIQVRTVCEDAWAVMSHFLSYKGVSATPFAQKRALHALAALFELADGQYERVRTELMQAEDYQPMSVLSELEGVFLSLGGEAFDRVLSHQVIEALLPAYADGTASSVAQQVSRWAEEQRGWLSPRIHAYYETGDGSIFLGQPEILMIGERLQARSSALLPVWSRAFAREELEAASDSLSIAIPGATTD